jgi:glutamate carboxypeptidase
MRSRALARLGATALLALATAAQATATGADARVMDAARQERQAFLDTLRELVQIDSGSRDVDGVRAVARLAAGKLKALGGEVQIIEPTDVEYLQDTPEQLGPAVKAVFKGRGTGRVLLIAHMDTVYPSGTWMKAAESFRIEGGEEDGRAHGLGVADCKQGVALAIHIAALLHKLGETGFETLTVLLNGDEEISSPGSRRLITQTARDQDAVFSFEGGGENGAVWLATSGVGTAYLSVKGRSAHAGVQPERGVNALYELSHQLLQMKDLSRPELGLRLNWTVAEAGPFRNVVPARATAQGDVRALRMADFDQLRAAMAEKLRNKLLPDSQIDLSFELRRPPLQASDAARALARRAQAIYRDELGLDMPVIETPMGGGTDAAFAAQETRGGVIEGMGLTGYGAHSGREYVLLNTVVPRLYMNVRMVQEIAAGKAGS